MMTAEPDIQTLQMCDDLWVASLPSRGISSIGITKELAIEGVRESLRTHEEVKRFGKRFGIRD